MKFNCFSAEGKALCPDMDSEINYRSRRVTAGLSRTASQLLKFTKKHKKKGASFIEFVRNVGTIKKTKQCGSKPKKYFRAERRKTMKESEKSGLIPVHKRQPILREGRRNLPSVKMCQL